MLSASKIAALQDDLSLRWHQHSPAVPDDLADDLLKLVAAQHLANFELWHEEDKARTPGATDHEIAVIKHSIDRINQRRNDLAEACDVLLMEWLATRSLPLADAAPHSETPGLIIDRLSVLSLKIFHTREEIARTDAPPGHAQRNQERHRILTDQQADLVECFDRLWQQVLDGERRIRIYRQMKMYNDPTLNPVLYKRRK